jgi:hypothetical protein
MAYYEINLIKDSVTRASRRRLIRWILCVYFLGCGAAVVAICYRGTQDLMALREQQDRVERLERHLLSDAAAARDVPQSVKALYGDLERTAEKLARADAFLGQRIFVVPILLGLVAPLPSESALASLEVDQKNGTLRFDLIMPINPTDHVTHSSLLLAAWNGDPHLVKRVQEIRLVTTQQKNIRGRKVFVAHFEGTLRSKG